MSYLKFGFHLGPGGNAQGHNEFIHALDDAGIPFFVTSADDMPFAAQELARRSSQDNIVIYRRSVPANGTTPPSGNPDMPDYNKPPREAAIEHWQWHKAHFPPELDPAITWVETINGPDKNRSEWLAAFAIETTINDLTRTINTLRAEGVADADMWVEIHNEPNLVVEGWTTSWRGHFWGTHGFVAVFAGK